MRDTTKYWKASQSLMAERICEIGGQKVRALLERNAYDSQSYLRLYAWTNESGWAVVTAWPISSTLVAYHSYTTREDGWQTDAESDLEKAIAFAEDFFAEPMISDEEAP